MTKIAHILGNGPSRKDFVNDPQGDIFGCNLSDFSLPLKATFIMDAVMMNHIHNNHVRMPWPIIMCISHSRIAEICDPKVTIMDLIDKNLDNGESTGHYAAGWCGTRYDEIHLWGFDSMWKETVESDTKDKMPNAPQWSKNWKPWRDNWEKLFREPQLKNCRFIRHAPIS